MVRDGKSINMFAYGPMFYSSEDNGDTWSSTELEWYTKFQDVHALIISNYKQPPVLRIVQLSRIHILLRKLHRNFPLRTVRTDNHQIRLQSIAGSKGLHRHVIGGSAVELVIDPSLSSFGNPSRDIVNAIALENEEFLAQFSDGAVIKFYYDAAVPARRPR